MFDMSGTYTDQYQLTMGQVYFLKGQASNEAIFDYFFRTLPFAGGYTVFAGLAPLLEMLENLRFTEQDIEYLEKSGFNKDYIDYLSNFRFQGTVYACQEGEIIFPNCPALIVQASLIEAQLIETLLLNTLNFQSLIATKASRIRQVAGDRRLIDFGLRRAQGLGGYHASRAALLGGFEASSHVRAGRDFDFPVSGTMAHSFVQSYEHEYDAFKAFADIWPRNTVLLVDTYDSIQSGIPHAIRVGLEMAEQGAALKAIRIDSGDLAYLSKKARGMLDEAGLQNVKIAVSNQLDEYVIKSLLEQNAPIDMFGVGTTLVTGKPDAALDGVYKLAFANHKPRIKLSESISKVTLPAKKQVYRLLDAQGRFIGADLLALEHEKKTQIQEMFHPFNEHQSMLLSSYQKETLLQVVMKEGKQIIANRSIAEISDFRQHRLQLLPEEYKRFANPHVYKVGITKQLKKERDFLKASALS